MKSQNSPLIPSLLNRRFFLLSAGSFALSTLVASCRSTPSANNSGVTRLRVGISSIIPQGEILEFAQKALGGPAGLDIQIVEFGDFVLPNFALRDKELDANYYQHVPFMEDFSKQHGIPLVSVAPISLSPLGLYSKRLKSLSELQNGAKISLSNDVTNLGRALKFLEANDLLKLKGDNSTRLTTKNIVENPKNIRLVELDASLLPRSLDDVDLSVISSGSALRVDLVPSRDALVLETAENNPYANVLAVLKGRETDPNIQTLAQILTSPQVKRFIEEKYEGSVLPAS